MAVYVGMLRVARLCARSPRVLGARGGLSRAWQEARLWGVRPLRYAALEERDGSVPWEGVLGILHSLSGGPIVLRLGGPRLPHLRVAHAKE